ncbi:MAG: AAA family ATPase [Caldilineaceae bacterium]
MPIGEQFFARLRARAMIYVDKTEQIYGLMNTGAQLFLSRPRRFGKSLLVTTLKEIYQGNKALFQGLWIEDKLDWEPHPVLLINFNDLDYREQSLAQALTKHMDDLAREHQITLIADEYKEKFRELIQKLSAHGEVVLLIDEYDKPITDLLENEQKTQEHVAVLKNFYSVLKSVEAEALIFTFITGVSKYGKISIFSDLNNLLDITMDRRFATLLGYTQTELEHYFADYLIRLAQTYAVSHAELIQQIAFWYDGYSWDGDHRVYVPFSTLVFLEQQNFANHWFATGTPTFLIKLLHRHGIPAYDLEMLQADSTLLESADVHNMSALSLLFQTGYLTVKQVHKSLMGDSYELGYPNYEVTRSFQQHLLADYLNQNIDVVRSSLLNKLQQMLSAQNLDGFITIFQAVFANIPSHLFLAQEAYFHSVVYLVLKLLGFAVYAERPTNLGRIDAVLEMPQLVYVLEFKMSSAEVALQQIRDRQYAQSFADGDRPVILIGIAFDADARNIVDWKHASYDKVTR